jgi:hypothetical protein
VILLMLFSNKTRSKIKIKIKIKIRSRSRISSRSGVPGIRISPLAKCNRVDKS